MPAQITIRLPDNITLYHAKEFVKEIETVIQKKSNAVKTEGIHIGGFYNEDEIDGEIKEIGLNFRF